MTKKSKAKNKVTSAAVSDSNTQEKNNTSQQQVNSEAYPTVKSTSALENGNSHSSALITDTSQKLTAINNSSSSPTLASIPGIVDDFLAPKFVKVLSLSDHGYEKNPPPALSEIRSTDGNANKVQNKKEEAAESNPPPVKKNKRKKSKPVKHTSNLNTSYDSEDGRELDDLSLNGNGGNRFRDHLQSGLTTKDVTTLKQHQRIRSSAFHYEGNNIVLVSNDDDDNAQYPTTSCYDDYNFEYEDDLEIGEARAVGRPPCRTSVRSDETTNLLLDQDDDDDEEGREGSWSVPGAHHHHADYCYPNSKVQASSSVASSESENNASSLSTTTSSSTYGHGKPSYFPALLTCQSISDGANNPCEIKDCTKLANKKCSQCKSVFYCGEDHQRTDWKKHKNECIPYRMETRFDDVAVAVASRNIPAGQTIFSEKPLLVLPVADPNNDFLNVMDVPCIRKRLPCSADLGPVVDKNRANDPIICSASKPACFGCFKSVELAGPPRYKCNKCQLPLCSYQCQFETLHQAMECQAISSSGGWKNDQYFCSHTMYLDIEIVRALQMEALDSSKWERFMEMKQNLRVESYKNSVRYQRFFENYRELVPISAKLSGYNDDLIGNVHAIITALSFRPALKSPYKLLFTIQILFGHDCIPNTFHYLEESPSNKVSGMTLVTKSAVPICKKELITIDFSPTPFLYYPLRRMILRNVLSIDHCVCKRCVSPSGIQDHSGDIKCKQCPYGVICPEKTFKWSNSVWSCTNCLEEVSYQKVATLTKECREELVVILSQPRQLIVPLLTQFINRRENDLHPGHSIILHAQSYMETQLRPSLAARKLPGPGPRYDDNTLEEYRLLERCSTAIDDHLKVIRPGICYERGCLLFNLYHKELAVAAKHFAIRLTKRKEYIQELMKCMKILQESLKIFQNFEGYNRDVALHIQEATSAIVMTKSFIQQQIYTDSEETKQRNATALANATSTLMNTYLGQ